MLNTFHLYPSGGCRMSVAPLTLYTITASVDNRYFHAIYCTIMILPYKFVQSQGILCDFKEKNAMLTAERRRSIMQTLQREGKVLASELSRSLHVSEDTIRRDLRELAAAGQL